MLHENIRYYRKNRGLTQEELAIRVNVVRQTVSKWEKGLSVPDADMLQRISEVLEVPVSRLLGKEEEPEKDRNAVAEQLSRINEQLAIRNRRAKRIWTVVGVIVAAWLLLRIVGFVLSYAAVSNTRTEMEVTAEYQEIADENGNVFAVEEVSE